MTLREKAVRGASALVLVLLSAAVALDRREVTRTANASRASLASGRLPAALALADQGRPYRSWFSAPALETRLFDEWHGQSVLPGGLPAVRRLLSRRPGWTPYQIAALHALLAHAFEGPAPDANRARAALEAFDAISWGGRDQHLGAMFVTARLALPGEPSAAERARLLGRLGAALNHEPYARLGISSLLPRFPSTQILHALPASPGILRSAFSALAGARTSPDLLYAVHTRWRDEVLGERERTLTRLETRPMPQAKQAVECNRLLSLARLDELDDPLSRAQVARIAAAWPSGVPGRFSNDPRTAIVKAFSEIHLGAVAPAELVRLAADLDGVPAATRARLLALAGRFDDVAAMSLKEGARGELSWTPVFLAGIDAALSRGDLTRAADFEGWLAPAARLECGSLVTLRDLARARKSPEAEDLDLAVAKAGAFPEGGRMAGGGRFPVCLDPLRTRQVLLEVRAESPALVALGWDGLRSVVVRVNGSETLSLDTFQLRGRHWLTFATLGGGPVVIEGARRLE